MQVAGWREAGSREGDADPAGLDVMQAVGTRQGCEIPVIPEASDVRLRSCVCLQATGGRGLTWSDDQEPRAGRGRQAAGVVAPGGGSGWVAEMGNMPGPVRLSLWLWERGQQGAQGSRSCGAACPRGCVSVGL